MKLTTSGARLGATAFGLAGLLFLLFPLLRPWHDETTASGAVAAFGASAWIASHMFGALGFVLVPLGLLAVLGLIGSGAVGRSLVIALVMCWLGTGLLLPFFGAETFGLNAVAAASAAGLPLDVLALSDDIRMGAVAVTTFGLGLLLVGVAAVVAALAIWRSEHFPRYAGVLFAIGFATYLLQFFGPPWLRIAHGVVLALGLFVLAAATIRVERQVFTAGETTSGERQEGAARSHIPVPPAAETF